MMHAKHACKVKGPYSQHYFNATIALDILPHTNGMGKRFGILKLIDT